MKSLIMLMAERMALLEFGLVEGDSTGAREARFSALVERQARFVFRVAHAVLRNVEDAEDVVQELFLKLYRSRAWERMNDERAFLARSAWRLAAGKAGKRASEQLDPAIASREVNPEAAAIAANRSDLVHRLMDALPEELRQVMALSAIDGLDSRRIGEAMGIPEGTVRTRQMRARAILKSKLAGLAIGNAHD